MIIIIEKMKKTSFLTLKVFLLVGICLTLLSPSIPGAAEMEQYCIIPPYVKRDVTPNILINMDNALVMGNMAYAPTEIIGDGIGDDDGVCESGEACEDIYNPAETYDGYFIPTLMYEYTGNDWVPNSAGLISGNLLNWATTSRYDLLQSILVGGKSRNRISYPNTLVSLSNSWTKTYSGCVFEVNNANLVIKDETAGSCPYLDGTAMVSNESESEIRVASADIDRSKGIMSGIKEVFTSVIDFLIPSAHAAKPLKIAGGPSNLSDGEETVYYTATLSASGGTEDGYTWSISAGSLPTGLCLKATTASGSGDPCASGPFGPGELTITIAGTPTLAGIYNFTLMVDDSGSDPPDTKNYTIEILPAGAGGGLRSSPTFNVWICRGNYTDNCNIGSLPPKEGIVDLFWQFARWGLQDFKEVAGVGVPNPPSGSICIPASPKSSFMTAIENAVPIDVVTPLVDGIFDAVDYYENTTGSCDPYDGVEPCLKSFILLITSGEGADQNNDVTKVSSDPDCTVDSNGDPLFDISENTCYGYVNDLRALTGKQNVETFIVNTMGVNRPILEQAAEVGGGNYYHVTNANELRQTLIQAFQDLLKRAASGTAASVLASGEGEGANLVQAVFYPRTPSIPVGGNFDRQIMWAGRLTNYWYYVDPYFEYSSMREETDGLVAGSYKLNLQSDYIASFYFDTINEQTKAALCIDSDGNGSCDSPLSPPDSPILFEKVGKLWGAGIELWKRDITTDKRKIYTTINGSSFLAGNFSADTLNGDSDNAAALRSYFDLLATDGDGDGFLDGDLDRDNDVDDDDARILIRYTHGEDFTTSYTWLRSRTVAFDLDNSGAIDDLPAESEKVWKLGDILDSTPKISSWIKLNKYDEIYSDKTYERFVNDLEDDDTPKATPIYTNRGMVFTGGNDGLLHAIKLGELETEWAGQGTYEKARLTGTDLGKEIWAFIPKNTLPYLKYIKELDYCHIHSIDLSPFIFDASITGNPGDTRNVSSWETILIGGMRYGGACRNSTDSCTEDLNGDSIVDDKDCVKTPSSNNGYSSYFAIKITDQNNPELLWEFNGDPASGDLLGFTTTGPAVVRVSTKDAVTLLPEKHTNGHWFVVLGSGPTGPIDTTFNQFMGLSDQSLKLFVLDLKTGTILKKFNTTGISNAFAGSMLDSTHDIDFDYQDDVLYIPYVKKDSSVSPATWTQGSILRILTNEDENPSNWSLSTLMENIGPVTSSVAQLHHKNKGQLWLYAGTGRYFFERGTDVDDATGHRQILGFKDPCYSTSGYASPCPAALAIGDLVNVDDPAVSLGLNPDLTSFNGWYINLDIEDIPGGIWAERVITDPLAITSGVVFFTSFAPYADLCSYGGKSYLWGVKHDTGGAAGELLEGVALIQVSTGSIEQLDISEAFKQDAVTNPDSRGERRSAALEGVPPTAQGLSIVSSPPAIEETIHIRER